jgi:hypothetical protein
MALHARRSNPASHLVSAVENGDGLSDLTHFNRELAQYEFSEGST